MDSRRYEYFFNWSYVVIDLRVIPVALKAANDARSLEPHSGRNAQRLISFSDILIPDFVILPTPRFAVIAQLGCRRLRLSYGTHAQQAAWGTWSCHRPIATRCGRKRCYCRVVLTTRTAPPATYPACAAGMQYAECSLSEGSHHIPSRGKS